MPAFPSEIEYLKILSRIKNRMMDNYDLVYPNETLPETLCEVNLKVMEIREVFFAMITPFLHPAYKAIKKSVQDPRNLGDFFDKDEYLENIKANCDEQMVDKSITFAKALIESRSFVHFMDGYLVDEIMNFDQVNSILCFRGDLN